ncbi:metal ABC transporter solute-binding protein, Zn/Mn family [Brackiella oedipodis]|uniref:metal ABC transporter solute-binding protein, Zn/Mn family n=1 Tax=Brackiella oedipodis TaxID=124225 RepID=UPI00049005F9|nr:zinc ABC transporter substrate-binding protein [Brackiella oedipodis]
MKTFQKSLLKTAVMAALVGGLGMTSAHADPLKVVGSFTIISDLVKNVGGDHVKVETVVGPDVDLHHFELKPSTMKILQGKGDDEVKLFFVNGLELEPWATKLKEAADFKGQTVVVSEGVQTIANTHEHEHEHEGHDHDHEGHDHHDHDHHDHADHDHDHDHEGHDHEHEHAHEGHEHHHHHGAFDPHIWQSPANAKVMVDNIAKALEAADAEHAADYRKNAEAYKDKITKLSDEVKADFDKLPAEQKVLGTNHEAFAYYVKDFGLKQIAVSGLGDSEPSAQEVAKIMQALKAQGAKALFLENTKNGDLLKQVAKDTGIKIGGTLVSDALTKSGATSSYLGMIEENSKTILKALK